ncbi:LytR/AlgR family response regulator transcription factor [Aureispira anguillae]|uniref:LytTR family DNA-binding domain-containing protein n=1 Tax=Aureispira anguillae TaxID=2864201 RepID=A0A915YHU5_9BACT|nr:LytTR family DNA-binding domain-containing protein [Aureispira anguillae]BDS13246.1 LytTR family DNA-binding domain-containing protein [Aureispira anguillae]
MKTIIIDDEEQGQRILKNLISMFFPDIEIVAICSNIPEAVIKINQLQPDAVFCDIEMPQYSGLDLLSFFKKINFEVIFATGHSEYAIQAFEMSAIDYLLKPIQLEKLELAIKKLRQKIEFTTMYKRLQTLKFNLSENIIHNIALPVADGLIFVETKKIALIEANGAYTKVWQKDTKAILISKNIKFFEKLVKNQLQFYKIHRSSIVNINYIQKYSKREGYLTLSNGKITKIAREKKKMFEAYISNLNL